MNAVTAGILVALVVAGYPLYELVTTGQLDSTSALLRGAVVAGGCAAGITFLVRLALSWEDAAERDRVRKLNSLFTDMEGAMAQGTLRAEDDPPAGGGTPG